MNFSIKLYLTILKTTKTKNKKLIKTNEIN